MDFRDNDNALHRRYASGIWLRSAECRFPYLKRWTNFLSHVSVAMPNLTFNCLFTSEKTFFKFSLDVDTSRNNTASYLKELIKEKLSKTLDNVKSKDLMLWLVPQSDANNNNEFEKLSSLGDPDAIPYEHRGGLPNQNIHLIIQENSSVYIHLIHVDAYFFSFELLMIRCNL